MKKNSRLFFYLLVILLFLNGCNSHEATQNEDLFQYKNTYVGDNGAVGNITRELPSPDGEQLNSLELKTTEQPYGIILNYIPAEKREGIERNYKELALFNATLILSLVHNADWVAFHFVEQEFVVKREELQNFYGIDINQFTNEEELTMFIQEFLEDDHKVNEFYQ
ncbi:DUF4825 domain-containing protein [Alkalihalobacillus sp. MEB130]|uniref:DUF4825 domain-containing protein n=1 Tax=Alkalihalobacillus sp. MEB130 TaxID=2976704 RepID=UPI0028DF5A8D|nr:DUF4825 domain-containing protein [Alkalihalobacillus sp. MEB130]MDT8862363.1 DUF4825 domain-containing protein [Alkalihalobacillus sp. MEB130]